MKHVDETVWQQLHQGQLDPERETELWEHLADCLLCQVRYAESVTPRMDDLADQLLSDDFTARTMTRLALVNQLRPTALPQRPPGSASFAVRRHRFMAYAVAASLTMVLMGSGLFRLLAPLPRATVETAPTPGTSTTSWAAKRVSVAPLLSQADLVPGAQQPLKIPPLRQLVERSSLDDKKK